MKGMQRLTTIFLALLLCLSFFGLAFADDDGKNYSVTITNLTKKQVLTPPVVITHKGSFKLFTIGQPAGEGLVPIAEGGDTSTLVGMLNARDDIRDYQVGGNVIPPGHSMTLVLKARNKHDLLSVVSMLATTNDAFTALNGIGLPKHSKGRHAPAYDAGSEANTELCTDVPGPPCPGDSGNARVEAGAEGFVHLHNGIHGVGDLNEHNMDFNNPVARIKITRVSADDDDD